MKNYLATFGLLLLVLSFYVNKNIKNSQSSASALDKSQISYGIIMGPPPCSWEVASPERVVSENKTQALQITTSNAGSEPCESVLYLRAPGFDITPNKEEQKISLEAGANGSISWILMPRKVGSYEIAVTDNLETKIFGITVKNLYGLNAVQAKAISFLGTIFGPMLTVPWWWDRLRKKRQEL